MANEKDLVSKSNQISDQNANIRQLIENATVWYQGSSLPSGFPSGNLGGPKDPGGPSTGNLPDVVDASILAEAFQSFSRKYTRVRKVRYRKIFQTSSGSQVQINQTEIAHLNDAYRQSSFYTDINSTAVNEGVEDRKQIDDTTFNNFVSSLYSKWLTHKEQKVNFDFVYCHSSCHSSCHSAGRGRR